MEKIIIKYADAKTEVKEDEKNFLIEGTTEPIGSFRTVTTIVEGKGFVNEEEKAFKIIYTMIYDFMTPKSKATLFIDNKEYNLISMGIEHPKQFLLDSCLPDSLVQENNIKTLTLEIE